MSPFFCFMEQFDVFFPSRLRRRCASLLGRSVVASRQSQSTEKRCSCFGVHLQLLKAPGDIVRPNSQHSTSIASTARDATTSTNVGADTFASWLRGVHREGPRSATFEYIDVGDKPCLQQVLRIERPWSFFTIVLMAPHVSQPQ